LTHHPCQGRLAAIGFGAWLTGMSLVSAAPADAQDHPSEVTSAPQAQQAYRYTNRLIRSNDPYLLLHAHNPVDWYPWGPEALAKAKKENKPIFLSIGYSTCYWCHVAERTIYSNPEIAALMNRWFINVKVDREERPDIDQLYMSARQILTGGGSWPNNLFLTPDLKPFYAGSYFPPADDTGQGPGFTTVLKSMHEYWTEKRPEVESVADELAGDLRAEGQRAASDTSQLDPKGLLGSASATLLPLIDQRYGGIQDPGGTKFPRSPELAMLLSDYQINRNEAALAAVRNTLDALAYGGIHDQLAGGFHRYSTERTWSVPHFEKMLSDNAQLLRLYTRLFQLTADPFYREQALTTGQYLARDMRLKSGGFFSAQDAEVKGVEGASYLWTRAQIAAVLGGAEMQRFLGAYQLVPIADVHDQSDARAGVLRIRLPIEPALEQAGAHGAAELISLFAADRAQLLAARAQREQPARDEKIVISTNGLAIAALAESGSALDRPEFIAWARSAAMQIWMLAYDRNKHVLQHEIFRNRAQTTGYLQDYALLGLGYLSLAQATGEDIWRTRAALLADDVLHRFARSDGSLASSVDETHLLAPVSDDGDGDMPSGTSAAIDLLQRIAVAFNQPRYADAARAAMGPISARVQRHPEAWSATIVAINSSFDIASLHLAAAPPDHPIGAPATADHVRVSAALSDSGAVPQVVVTIKVDDGYHIYANPGSLDYLIPTAVTFDQVRAPTVVYPKGEHFQPAFAPEGIDVYEGAVTLVASFASDETDKLRDLSGTVRAQACDAQSCLPPSDLHFSVLPLGDRQ
jgi:uncharacterized protein YyaL (SSP411 family)